MRRDPRYLPSAPELGEAPTCEDVARAVPSQHWRLDRYRDRLNDLQRELNGAPGYAIGCEIIREQVRTARSAVEFIDSMDFAHWERCSLDSAREVKIAMYEARSGMVRLASKGNQALLRTCGH